ncbi:MAG TPA: hypothetical protein DIT01_15130 [Lentisphaeria bacterium]|nr:hypothetical protein [Lentisphaeria bacterium]|tara:strand:+ start:1411 stop:1773 length:363 start_codon:yes stop_codon:yes gene_type:complete
MASICPAQPSVLQCSIQKLLIEIASIDDIIFGAGVRLNAHGLTPNNGGEVELILGTIGVGDRAAAWGCALLTAGTRVSAGEGIRVLQISPPVSRFANGRRFKEGAEEDDSPRPWQQTAVP